MKNYLKYITIFLILVITGIITINLYHQNSFKKISNDRTENKKANIESEKEEEQTTTTTTTATNNSINSNESTPNSNNTTSDNKSPSKNDSTNSTKEIKEPGKNSSTNTTTTNSTYEVIYVDPSIQNETTTPNENERKNYNLESKEETITKEETNSNYSTITFSSPTISEEEFNIIEVTTEKSDTTLTMDIESSKTNNSTTTKKEDTTSTMDVESSKTNNSTTAKKDSNESNQKNSIYSSNFKDYKGLNKYNQAGNSFSSNSVCARGGNSVAATGCGLSTYMATRYVLTGKNTNYMDFAHEACNTGFYNGLGSEIPKAIDHKHNYENKYGIEGKSISKNYDTIVSELKKGRVVDVLIRCGQPTINKGGFNATSNGHYIALINYNNQNNKIYVYNPNIHNTGWQSESIIKKYVVQCATGIWSMKSTNS